MFVSILIIILQKLNAYDATDSYPCGTEDRCSCWTYRNVSYMDCHYKWIQAIPLCPPDLNVLYLQDNFIIAVASNDLENLTNLELLDLARNRLIYLDPDAFHNLQKLKKLNLEGNRLQENDFQKGLFKPLISLTYLNTRFNSPTSIPDTVLAVLKNIKQLAIDFFYRFDRSHGKGFNALKKLRELVTGHCSITQLRQTTFMYMAYLENIDLSSCVDIKSYKNGALNLTYLKHLDLSNTKLDFGNVRALLTDLELTTVEKLVMNNALYLSAETALKTIFQHLNKSNIRDLRLGDNQLRCQGVYHLPSKLRTLDLSGNRISECILIMPNLIELDLHNNDLGQYLSFYSYMYTYADTTQLEYVDLSSNNIKSLSSSVFRGHSRIVAISLSNNKLQDITFDLSQTQTLKILDLSRNSISYFDQETIENISKILMMSNLTIDLSQNLLECSCKTMHFLKWLAVNLHHFHEYQNYKCKFQNGTIISFKKFRQMVLLLEKECSSYLSLIVGVSLGIITACGITSSGLLYRYRWKLRYMFYMTRRRFRRHENMTDNEEYPFNAFISYSDKETNFILHELITNLEQNGNIKLCIHQRDFIPGEEITVNITNAIHTSKKTICIITRSFLDSYYCMFEFNMARMESIYSRGGQNILFLVLYEQIQTRDLPLVMLERIQQQSYIEYPNDEQGNVVFWQKIRETIC